jgi:ribonuclease P protein component
MPDFGFGKEYRLLNSHDFSYLRGRSRCVSNKNMRAYFKPSQVEGGPSRVGFSISKKVGNAVVRNFVKRRCREVFRTHALKQKGLDALVVVSPRIYSEDWDELSKRVFKSIDDIFLQMEKN